jgi:hypothetical protein
MDRILENLGLGHPKDHARPLLWTVLKIPLLDVSNKDCSLVLLISSLPLMLLCQNFIQTNHVRNVIWTIKQHISGRLTLQGNSNGCQCYGCWKVSLEARSELR